MADFATAADVANRWRPLSTDEQTRAGVLLDDASDMIRTRWPDIDARIAAGTITSQTMTRITASMVKRAMLNANSDGESQSTDSAGPFSHSATYANPNGNLYFTADDIATLDGIGWKPRVTMGWLAE